MVPNGIVYTLGIAPGVLLTYWYSRRLREVKEARESTDKSAEAFQRCLQLEARVNRQGLLAFGGLLTYYVLLSVIFR